MISFKKRSMENDLLLLGLGVLLAILAFFGVKPKIKESFEKRKGKHEDEIRKKHHSDIVNDLPNADAIGKIKDVSSQEFDEIKELHKRNSMDKFTG